MTGGQTDDSAIDRGLFWHADGIHGVGHTLRVLTHARRIAAAVGAETWQVEALVLAARWHDIGRIHDDADYFHGARSHGVARALRLHASIDPRTAEVAFFAVEQHCTNEAYVPKGAHYLFGSKGAEEALHVWRMLKDADGLDRVRLHHGRYGVNKAMLRFEYSRTQVEYAWALFRGEVGGSTGGPVDEVITL